MKPILFDFDTSSSRPIYLQLYDHIKSSILKGDIKGGEKLPSLRALSKSLCVSLTTVSQSYSQLLVEGYIDSKPNSGYYINNIGPMAVKMEKQDPLIYEEITDSLSNPVCDLSCFDFNKWKRCSNKIFTEFPQLLLFEGDPQGELPLRYEISKYVYGARGVTCNHNQVVIGAGTQHITGQLTGILHAMGINHVSTEDPGYLPVRNIFRDRGFVITPIPVREDGIAIEKLPQNIPSATYVSPSNQFPTGAIMPIGKRRELLEWAEENNSIIIEDDYDSELRYFGKPVPAMQGMDSGNKVVYLGSFSSTLFPAIKISYMILPEQMAQIFEKTKADYTQTCSKAEQLTLALFMKSGLYQTNIKKLRSLYSQKLQRTISAVNNLGKEDIFAENTSSGINMILKVKTSKSAQTLSEEARSLGLTALPMESYVSAGNEGLTKMIFYYNQIPLNDINATLEQLIDRWRNTPEYS